MKIISIAHSNNSFNTPIIQFEDLSQLQNDIVVISGGKGSHIYEYLRRDNIDAVSYTHLTLPTSDLV